MGKKRKNRHPKNPQQRKLRDGSTASTSLLPACRSGEKHTIPFKIKSEEEENSDGKERVETDDGHTCLISSFQSMVEGTDGAQDQNIHFAPIAHQTVNSSIPAKSYKVRNFSTDILRYFNVSSEIDRFECKILLEYVSNHVANNSVEELFPIIKKERKDPQEINKGDILFKKVPEMHYDSKDTSTLRNYDSDSDIENSEIQVAKTVVEHSHVPALPLPNYNCPTLSASKIMNEVRGDILLKEVTSEMYNDLDGFKLSSASTAKSSTASPELNSHMSIEQMEKILTTVQLTDTDLKSNEKRNFLETDHHPIILEDSDIKKKRLNLENGEIQVSKTVVEHPHALPLISLPTYTYPTLTTTSTSNKINGAVLFNESNHYSDRPSSTTSDSSTDSSKLYTSMSSDKMKEIFTNVDSKSNEKRNTAETDLHQVILKEPHFKTRRLNLETIEMRVPKNVEEHPPVTESLSNFKSVPNTIYETTKGNIFLNNVIDETHYDSESPVCLLPPPTFDSSTNSVILNSNMSSLQMQEIIATVQLNAKYSNEKRKAVETDLGPRNLENTHFKKRKVNKTNFGIEVANSFVGHHQVPSLPLASPPNSHYPTMPVSSNIHENKERDILFNNVSNETNYDSESDQPIATTLDTSTDSATLNLNISSEQVQKVITAVQLTDIDSKSNEKGNALESDHHPIITIEESNLKKERLNLKSENQVSKTVVEHPHVSVSNYKYPTLPNTADESEKGDILFKKVMSEALYDSESVELPMSTISHSSADSEALKSNMSSEQMQSSKYFNRKRNAAETDLDPRILRDLHFKEKRPNLENSEIKVAKTVVVYPQVSALPISSPPNYNYSSLTSSSTMKETKKEDILIKNLNETYYDSENVDLISSTTSHSYIDSPSLSTNISSEKIPETNSTVQFTDIDSKSPYEKNNVAATDLYQRSLEDPHFQKQALNLENNEIQVAKTFAVYPQGNDLSCSSVLNYNYSTLTPSSTIKETKKEDILFKNSNETYYDSENVDLISSSTSHSSIDSPSLSTNISSEKIPEINSTVQFTDVNSKSPYEKSNVVDLYQRNLEDQYFQKQALNLENNEIQVAKTAIVHPQYPGVPLPSQPNYNYPTVPNASYPIFPQVPPALSYSLPTLAQPNISCPVTFQVPCMPMPNNSFPRFMQPSTFYPVTLQVPSVLPNNSFQRFIQPNTFYPVTYQVPYQSLQNHSLLPQSSTCYSIRPQFHSLPKNDSQKLPEASSALAGRSITALSSMPQDPRLSAKKSIFAPRKGAKDLLLYHTVGKKDISKHLKTLILQWNPSWVTTQLNTGNCPPICQFFRKVSYQYPDKTDYYNTYAPLHLMHIWFGIYECLVQKTGIHMQCTVKDIEVADDIIKIVCVTALKDNGVLPKRDDIVYCMYNKEEAFLRVQDVRKESSDEKTNKKLKISLETRHDLNLSPDNEISINVLLNLRSSCLKIEALKLLDDNIEDMVFKPELYATCIEVVQLDKNKPQKDQRNDIIKAFLLEDSRVVLIETYYMCDTISLISLVSFCIVNRVDPQLAPGSKKKHQKPTKVLIILKSDELLLRLFTRMHQSKPILAVRTNQFQLPDRHKRSTLKYELQQKQTIHDILSNHHAYLTTFSAFGLEEKAVLSKIKNLTCIIDEAHLCTEVETALPLTLHVKKLLLMGNKDMELPLPSELLTLDYNVTLFRRMLKAKGKL